MFDKRCRLLDVFMLNDILTGDDFDYKASKMISERDGFFFNTLFHRVSSWVRILWNKKFEEFCDSLSFAIYVYGMIWALLFLQRDMKVSLGLLDCDFLR